MVCLCLESELSKINFQGQHFQQPTILDFTFVDLTLKWLEWWSKFNCNWNVLSADDHIVIWLSMCVHVYVMQCKCTLMQINFVTLCWNTSVTNVPLFECCQKLNAIWGVILFISFLFHCVWLAIDMNTIDFWTHWNPIVQLVSVLSQICHTIYTCLVTKIINDLCTYMYIVGMDWLIFWTCQCTCTVMWSGWIRGQGLI